MSIFLFVPISTGKHLETFYVSDDFEALPEGDDLWCVLKYNWSNAYGAIIMIIGSKCDTLIIIIIRAMITLFANV